MTIELAFHDGGDPADDHTSVRLGDKQLLAPEIRSWSSHRNAFNGVVVITQWVVILGAGALATHLNTWWAYATAICVIATRQHALGVLMHDAAHFRLFSNRVVNDLISDIVLAYPVGVSTTVYRRFHFAHHRNVNREDDPQIVSTKDRDEWLWPKSRSECLRMLALDLCGFGVPGFVSLVWRNWSPLNLCKRDSHGQLWMSRQDAIAIFVWVFAMPFLLAVWPGWKAVSLLWVLPSLTILPAISRIRSLAEHIGVEGNHELNESRTVIPQWWERLLLAPLNINYHLEHHLFPSVPWYNLGKLHRKLMNDPLYRNNMHITPSYLGLRHGVLGEVTRMSTERPSQSQP